MFNTVFEGSLFGRYPDTAAWLFFLALADARGHVDKTPEYIASVTGMPLSDLKSCIETFMSPDTRSRSQEEEGRKLVLIDPAREWGWRVVNIQLYRRKASGQDQVEDGRNAVKVKRYKERHRETPPDTAGHSKTPKDTQNTHSYSYSDSNADSEKNKTKNPPIASAMVPPRGATATRLPADFDLTPERRAIAEAEKADPEREFAAFTDHFRAAPGVKGRKNDWDATWRIWCRRAPDFKPRNGAARKTDYVPPKTIEQLEAEERAREQH